MNNKELLNNYILYFLTFIFICLIGITDVMASSLTGMKFIGRSANQYPFSTSYDPSTYVADYFTFNGNSSIPNYLILDTCGTGPLNFIITQGSGHFDYLGYIEYSNNTCTTGGYDGTQFIYYFGFTQFTDAGNGNLGVSFTMEVRNGFNYNTFVTYNNITFSDSSDLRSLINQNEILDNQNENNQDLLDNQNQNTQDIIDNQNQNTQDIIDNNDSNTDRIIQDNKNNFQTCKISPNIFDEKFYSNSSNYIDTGSVRYSFFINNSSNKSYNFYARLKSGKTRIANLNIAFSQSGSNTSVGDRRIVVQNGFGMGGNSTIYGNIYIQIWGSGINNVTISDIFDRYEFFVADVSFPVDFVKYGEICSNKLDDTNKSINNLTDSITDDDIDDATSEASDFFSDFSTDTFGLTSIITAPLTLIQSLDSSSCSSLHLPLPYLNNKYLDLPCMTPIYQNNFGTFFTLYQTITFGIVAYWVCVRIFNLVKDFKNPEHDEIEVLDL